MARAEHEAMHEMMSCLKELDIRVEEVTLGDMDALQAQLVHLQGIQECRLLCSCDLQLETLPAPPWQSAIGGSAQHKRAYRAARTS